MFLVTYVECISRPYENPAVTTSECCLMTVQVVKLVVMSETMASFQRSLLTSLENSFELEATNNCSSFGIRTISILDFQVAVSDLIFIVVFV